MSQTGFFAIFAVEYTWNWCTQMWRRQCFNNCWQLNGGYWPTRHRAIKLFCDLKKTLIFMRERIAKRSQLNWNLWMSFRVATPQRTQTMQQSRVSFTSRNGISIRFSTIFLLFIFTTTRWVFQSGNSRDDRRHVRHRLESKTATIRKVTVKSKRKHIVRARIRQKKISKTCFVSVLALN